MQVAPRCRYALENWTWLCGAGWHAAPLPRRGRPANQVLRNELFMQHKVHIVELLPPPWSGLLLRRRWPSATLLKLPNTGNWTADEHLDHSMRQLNYSRG
jgi:hypothetical protein